MQIRTALIVDDSRVARMTLSKLLVAHDFHVEEKNSGEEALAYLQSTVSKPAIIFMDVMMGGMDGLTATQQIKSNNELKTIPVVICTGNDTETDKNKALATGALAVLTKPPVADALESILAKLAPAQAEQSKPEPAAPVIDDVAVVAKAIASIEQSLLPNIQQQVREMAEDISRQIAQDTAEEISKEQTKNTIEAMMPSINEEINQVAKHIAEETANHVSKRVARDTVTKSAESAIQSVIDGYNFDAQVMTMLSNEGETWLKSHEEQLYNQISQQLQHDSAPMVLQHLEENLTSMVTPIVRTLIDESQAQSETVVNDSESMETLVKRVNMLNKVVMGLGVAIVGLVAMILF